MAPKPTEDESDRSEASDQNRKGEKKEHFDEIDLTGIRDWSLDEQKEAQELITEYASVFVMSDMVWVRPPWLRRTSG